MNKQELISILEYIKDDAADLCVDCANPVATSTRSWREPRPYGAGVAYEDCSEQFSYCHKCKQEETGSNLAEDILERLKGEKITGSIMAGHLIYLATVVSEVMESEQEQAATV
jgi:hypothetical protein